MSSTTSSPGKTCRKHASLMKSLPLIWTFVHPYWESLVVGALLIGVSQIARLVLPYSSKYLMDNVVLNRRPDRLVPLIGSIGLSILVHASAYFAAFIVLSNAAMRLTNDLRQRIQMHLIHLPVGYFDSNLSGTLVTRVVTDAEGILNLIGIPMLDFFASLLTGSIALALLMNVNWRLTLVLVGVLDLGASALYRAFSHVRPLMRETSKIRAELSGRLTESIAGIRVVKGYRAETREGEVFAQGMQRFFDNHMQIRRGMAAIVPTGALMTGFGTLVVMFIGGRWLLDSRWTMGDYVQYSALIMYIIYPVFLLVDIGTQFTQAIAGLDRVREVLAEKVEDTDEARIETVPSIDGEVRFEDVSFGYEADRPVLHNLTFEAAPGTVTALVGPSGSGKSTIISLLCAFHKPQSGRIFVDSTDISTATLDSYRTQLGLVLQETFLFDGSIRENLLFARPGASEAKMLDACRIARVDEFTEKFPKGYDTIVGERGVKLSGGQRQRLSIARAILADPRILILDEATSSLDSESEAMIQEGLGYLMQGRTTFVIAHRLSTIRRSDQILVLEEGRILERGTHDSLYELGGRYYDLYTRQYGLERNLFLAPFEGANAD